MAFSHIYAAMKFARDSYVKKDVIGTDKLHMTVVCFEPGQAQGAHTHQGTDKLLFVYQGTATVTVGSETRELGPGAVAVAKVGESHAVENRGRERVILVVVQAPPEPPKK